MRQIVTLTAAAALVFALAVGFGAPASAQNLVAYWNFDVTGADPTLDTAPAGAVPDDGILGSTSGTADTDDPAYDCTPANIAPTPGNVCSLDFTAAQGDFVQAANSADLNITGPITLAAWINPVSGSLGSFQDIISKGELDDFAGGFTYFILLMNTDKVRFGIDIGAAGDFVDSMNTVSGDVWTHVAATFDPGTDAVKIYLNGILDGSGSITDNPVGNTEPLFIGALKNFLGGIVLPTLVNEFDGLIDDVRIYNRVLTAAEVAQLATTLTITKTLELATEEVGTTDEDGLIDLFEEWAFEMKVTVTNDGPGDLTGLTLKDPLPGDLELGDATSGTGAGACPDTTTFPLDPSQGSVTTDAKGKTDKCFVFWNVGAITSGNDAMLTINVSTDLNPGRNRRFPVGHQEYTDVGPYCINQSAAVSGTIVEVPFTQKSNGLELDNKGDPLKLRVDDDCDDFVAADAPEAPLAVFE